MSRPSTMTRLGGAVMLAVLLGTIGLAVGTARGQANAGSITATVYGCPVGVTEETATPDSCELLTEGFGINIVSSEADLPVQPLSEATLDGTSFVWTGLPVPKTYRIDVGRPPASPYASHVIVGEGVVQTSVTLTAEAPDAAVTIYNFASGEPPDEFFDLPIRKINCVSLPQGLDLTVAWRQPTEECDPGAGVAFTVTDANTGEVLGTCVTTEAREVGGPVTAGCDVPVPFGASVIVTEDVSTAPAGFLPHRNDLPFTAPDAPPGGEVGGAFFVNVLQEDSPPPTGRSAVGRPAHVHAGTCDDLAREPRYDLTNLATPEGSPEGSEAAIQAEASYTVIDVSLDELLAGDFAIHAHASREEAQTHVACGNIGGVRDAAGGLAVGLREQNGSGYVGIAYFVPDPSDPDRTQVSLFLAEGLAEADDGTPVPE